MPAPAHDPLRPATLAEFAGQPDVRGELAVILGGARARSELTPHLLLVGPPGLGKTTLAQILATEQALPLVSTSGPAVDKPGDLAGMLVSLTRPSLVFIDEIHRLALPAQEMLYTAMEDGRIDILIGEGTGRARSIPMPLEPFVLVGATTRAGLLGGPMRDRFGYVGRLELYDTATLSAIVHRSAALLGVDITDDAAAMIASRSRGTPRVANKWLRRVRDLADHQGLRELIDAELTEAALTLFGVDQLGLDKLDRRVLTTLIEQFGGGPVGVSTLAAAAGEDAVTLEEVHEPYLMRAGLLHRTPRGRVAGPGAYRHLGRPVPAHLEAADGDALDTLPLG